jgi:UDP-2,3-diacylglucosamine pyrophosphatase LpxH
MRSSTGTRKLHFRTLILSDVHLGTAECRVDEVNHLLKRVECDKLILNGDIIDGWSLLRRGGWTPRHTRFVRLVLKKLEKRETEVIYLRGNHDDLLGRFLPIRIHNLRVVEEHVHETESRRYLVLHGDVFDVVTTRYRHLAVLGSVGYQALLRLNRAYNRYRAWRGLEYFSLSKAIKARVKDAVNHVGRFEEAVRTLARRKKCQGIICGHIHTPADKWFGDIHYLNSGDWVESMTALVEHHDGAFEILTYADFCDRLRAQKEGRPAVADENGELDRRLPSVA